MDALDQLRSLTVPTLANAVEAFGVVPANTGYNTQPLACHFPSFGMCVGYAATVTATTNRESGVAPDPVDEPEYWRWLQTRAEAGPIVLVLEDLDDPPGGAMWGEWNNSRNQSSRAGPIRRTGVETNDSVADIHAGCVVGVGARGSRHD